MMEELW